MRISTLTLNGTVTENVIDASITDQLAVLREDAASYFDLSLPHVMVPVKDLVTSRARPNGIVSANKLMGLAAAGKGAVRVPISVRPFKPGLWLIVDGNSTYVNAAHSDWSLIPCTIVRETDGRPG